MKGKSIVGIVIILIAVGILVYLGGLTFLEYNEYGTVDFPLVLMGDKFSGNIVSVDDKSIELQGVSGKNMKFEINSGTKRMYGNLTLEPGLYVTVIFKTTTDKKIAKAIRRPKKVPANLEKRPVSSPEGTASPADVKPTEPGKPGEPGMEGKTEEKPAEPGMEGKTEEKPAEPGMESKPGEKPAEPGMEGKPGEKPAEPGTEGKTEEKPAEGGEKKTE
ncbi:MAG: hypothetical protein LWY06_03215 [Firmicutes bacterium]|nr:hypothetical protein [Bacillota bacterium]